MNRSKPLVLIIILTLIAGFFAFDLQQYFSLEYLKAQQMSITGWYQSHPTLALIIYALLYIVITGLSLPGAAIMTLAGGAVFGLFWGTVVVSFASSIGATLAFLAARFLFRDAVKSRFGDRLHAVDRGMQHDGAFYLFTLRLVPVFPFFVINLVMGLTRMKTWTFYWVSQLGMLAGTIVYVNAGTQLGKIDSLAGILSPALLGSFVLLGLFPLIAKKVIYFVKSKKVYQSWKRPERFDTNVVVIGAGSGGLVAALIASAVKARVTLVERGKMGGDCLNTGCVPSKALIASTRMLAGYARAREFGLQEVEPKFEFAAIMERVQRVIAQVAPHDSKERFAGMGVDVVTGEGKIISPWEVEIKGEQGTQVMSTRSIIIAAGATPFIPSIPGLEKIPYLTSDTVWVLREKPARMLVLGGGPIGCELAQAFARLGVELTLLEMLPRLLIREDEEVSSVVLEQFQQEGINVLLEHKAVEFREENGEKVAIAEHQGETVRLPFDQILVAIGRAANISGYGLESVGIEITENRTVEVNEFMATNYPNIFACGDVAGPFQFTHTASHQAWYAAVNALFGELKKFRADYSVIPWATFTEPEVARVGLNEQEAKEKGIDYEVSTYNLDDLDRALADGEARGFVKVLTVPGKDRILGVTIVGVHAGDLIAEFVLAMKHKLGLNKILGTMHIYPTLAEANKFAAGVWKKNHAPEGLLRLIERYHAWKRG